MYFVNAVADAHVIEELVNNGVKLIALRCAGYNNVDLKAAKDRIKVVRVLLIHLTRLPNIRWL